MSEKKSWQTYEEVVTYLLNKFAEHFGLECVEGKQHVPGTCGTDWEIDAKGVAKNGDGFLIVECRRYTTSRLDQESVAGLAFRIQDTGAQGGFVVTPLDLQEGAKKVAAHENIHHVILDPNSTTNQYVLRFLKKVFVGVTASVGISAEARVGFISPEETKIINAMPQAEREAFMENFMENL
ncbi:restriction endonuclease [Candidatus Electronema sp. JC]|uniref:restriction endonuclease n=1 Tax=Candidatus Electronema sp. JC TaxID=3401570 RepID=UPI003AA8C6FE